MKFLGRKGGLGNGQAGQPIQRFEPNDAERVIIGNECAGSVRTGFAQLNSKLVELGVEPARIEGVRELILERRRHGSVERH